MPTLKQIRINRLLSMRELAAKAGVGLSTLYMIESGKAKPGLRAIRRLSATLNVEPTEVQEFRMRMEELGKARGDDTEPEYVPDENHS